MAIKTISLKGADSAELAAQAKAALADMEPRLLVFFASSVYPPDLARTLQDAFPACPTIGATSHSEFCNGGYTTGSVSIMAMDAGSVEDAWVEVVTGIRETPAVTGAVNRIHRHFGGAEKILEEFDNYVGIILFDSNAKAEERVMDRLGTASDILFVGGSSSVGEAGVSRVYANGASYEDAVVLAVLRVRQGFDIIKTQSASILSPRKLLVTKSDTRNRILHELDGRPCGEVYAEVLGVPLETIEDHFVSNPLGVVAGGSIFIRTFDQVVDGGITLHCGLPEGTEIQVLKTGDLVADTQAALDTVMNYQPAGVVNFNCLYRTLEMLHTNVTEPYAALFGRYPSIGFSTEGEAFLGHINETSTVLAIK